MFYFWNVLLPRRPYSSLAPFRVSIDQVVLHLERYQARQTDLKESLTTLDRVRRITSIVHSDLQSAPVACVNDPHGIGQTQGRLGNGGAGIEIVAKGLVLGIQDLRTHSEINEKHGTRRDRHLGRHEQIEPTIRPVIDLSCRIEVIRHFIICDLDSQHNPSTSASTGAIGATD